MNKKGFFFDGENGNHDYYFDGKRMTGCTTILSILAKPALIQWAANMAVEYLKINIPQVDIEAGFDFEDWGKLLEEARVAHRKKKEEAGTKGTDVHAIIENYIKEAIKDEEGYIPILGDEEKNEQVRHFVKWAIANKVKFLASEKQLYSEKLFIAGTCDFICEIDGKVWLGDIKTSSGIYPENFAQCAGYQIMIDENKLYEIAGHIIINLRKDGKFEEKRSVSTEDYKRFFLACLDIYRIQEKIKGQILYKINNKKTITI